MFERGAVRIDMALRRPADNPPLCVIGVTATNTSSDVITDFLFQAAVPKVSGDPREGGGSYRRWARGGIFCGRDQKGRAALLTT